MVIFRFDRREIEDALRAAAARGVFIHTLVTYTNRGGEKHLRQLEQRLLEAGVTVARTAGDLSRYHNKLMIIDRRVLFLLAFNFTSMDIDHSRSFGIVTEEGGFVREAVKLFEADTTRQPYTAGVDTFVVSPVNARKQLAEFIEKAQEGARTVSVAPQPALSRPGGSAHGPASSGASWIWIRCSA
jgi:cardiolipin synthase